MMFQELSAIAIATLVACVAAEPMKFTRASADQLGLLRREDDVVYQPETTECGEGSSCAEACGAGYLECTSTSEANHCFNPEMGETCCEFPGNGNSCETGYFCAHDGEMSTHCCAEGMSIEECANVNSVEVGALTKDPPMPTSTSTTYTHTSTTTSSELSKTSEASTSTYVQKPYNATNSTSTSTSTSTKPTVPVHTLETIKEGAAARFGTAATAVLLAAGAFAALF